MRSSFFILLFLAAGTISFIPAQPTDYYGIGKQYAEQGETKKALNIWLQARKQLEEPDPRIGFAFIELVTKQKLEDYYEYATYMYLWGLSGSDATTYKEALDAEVDRLQPLLDNANWRRLKNLVDEEDPSIYEQLSGYWRWRDPTASTDYNERLVEHWERIAYAREHFTRNRREPYGTDDRGPIYVRYGEPDLRKSGQLLFNSTMADQFITNIIASGELASTDAFGTNPENRQLIEGCINKLIQGVREFHNFPEYEIWTYRDLNPGSNQNTIFIFGTIARSGSFGTAETVEEFIKPRAFSMAPIPGVTANCNDTAERIRPGLVLQYLYYNQLAATDHFFGATLSRIESRALNREVLSVSLGEEMQVQARFDLKEARLRSPREESVYENTMIDIPVETHQYRMLNEQGDPVLATFVESRPQKAFLYDYYSQYAKTGTDTARTVSGLQREQLSHYELMHHLQLFGERREPITRARHSPPIAVGNSDVSTSVLTVPHRSEGTRQVVSAELRNRDPSTAYSVDTPFPKALRGLGKTEVEQPAPLEGPSTALKMSDLVLGYDKQSGSGNDLFPFTVSHERRIPEGETLVIHYEVYNLEPKPDGITSFRVDYEIRPVNIMGWTRERKDDLTVSLQFEHDQTRLTEDLEIQAANLEPGKYVLRMQVTDRVSGQEFRREVEFEVVE